MLTQVAAGVPVRTSEFVRTDTVVVPGRDGDVLLVDDARIGPSAKPG